MFIPETIGALVYLSRNIDCMKRNIVAGYNLTCLGDERSYSFLPSRAGETLSDRAALCVLREKHPDFIQYSFLDRGSDERQYCSPGVDLPVASVMRSKYREYPEYHTSLDNLEFVKPHGLAGGFAVLRDCIDLIEGNLFYRVTCIGEPQLGRRGLYPIIRSRESQRETAEFLNFLAYADGTSDLIDISNTIEVPPWKLYPIVRRLEAEGLIDSREKPF